MCGRSFAFGADNLTLALALNAKRGGPIGQVEQAGSVEKQRFDEATVLCLVHSGTILRMGNPSASQDTRVELQSGSRSSGVHVARVGRRGHPVV